MTGYTYRLIEKKQTFPEFALSCARAFGALIDMREDSLNAEIPERFQPNPWHQERLREAQEKLATLEAMSEQERHNYGYQKKDEAVKHRIQYLCEAREKVVAMEAVLYEAVRWTPPTPEHTGLKEFMVQQLTDSIAHENVAWCETYLEQAKQMSVADYFAADLEGARENISYHYEEWQKEAKRTEERNQWLADLRASLR